MVPSDYTKWELFIRAGPSVEPSHRENLPNPETPEEPLVFDEDPSIVSALEYYRTGPRR